MSDQTTRDKIEFALRDAGFDYDEAFRIATLVTQPDAGEMPALYGRYSPWMQENLHHYGRQCFAAGEAKERAKVAPLVSALKYVRESMHVDDYGDWCLASGFEASRIDSALRAAGEEL
jgi:hypothetical protein